MDSIVPPTGRRTARRLMGRMTARLAAAGVTGPGIAAEVE